MKLKAVIEYALAKDDDEERFGRNLEADKRELERTLPENAMLKSVVHVAENDDLRAEFKKLLRFKCESTPPSFTPRFKKLTGYEAGDEDAAFYSESFLYPLLGKEDARTILALLHNLMRTCGIDPHELGCEVNSEIAAEEKAEAERVEVVDARRAFSRKYAKEKGWDHERLTASQYKEIRAKRVEAGIR